MRTQTSKGVDSVNIHGTATTDTLSATPPKCQGWVDFVLDPDQSVQHHGTSLVQVERITLHSGFRPRLVRIPPVDMESLDLCILARAGAWILGGCVRRSFSIGNVCIRSSGGGGGEARSGEERS